MREGFGVIRRRAGSRRAGIAAGFSIATLLALPGCAASKAEGPAIALEIEVQENTVDACMSCGCRAVGMLEPGTPGEWWIAYGLVAKGEENGWVAEDASTRCGAGTFDSIGPGFRETIGSPYIVLDLALTANPGQEGVPLAQDARIDVTAGTRVLAGFDRKGRAEYTPSEQRRTLAISGAGELVLPLLVPSEREKELFGVHEVVARLRATVVGATAEAYGSVAVSAEVPGAEVLLDGGFAGRVPEGRPLVLSNVLAGDREIRVRDFSSREASRRVTVDEGDTTEVRLSVLDLESDAQGKDLAPIGPNPQGYEEFWRAKDQAVVVRVPGGEFVMGSDAPQSDTSERPQRSVYVSTFLIDKTEVTWRQYRAFAAATGRPLPEPPVWGSPDDYPASYLLWDEAQEYCEWVGGRLPTEAEWEKAARGEDGRTYHWGEKWDAHRCNSLHGGFHRPDSVGSYALCVSPYGVVDMAGSVWEWCADWFDAGYYAVAPERDPPGPSWGETKVLRGASWMSPYLWLRTSFRYKADPDWRNPNFGFRCAQDVPQ